jgi:hypothetical protein
VGLQAVEGSLHGLRRRGHLDRHWLPQPQHTTSVCPAGRCLSDPQHPLVTQEVVAQELRRRQLKNRTVGDETMRTEAANMRRLCHGDGTFLREHVREQRVTRPDAVQAFGADLAARKRWLVEGSLAEGV